MGLCTSRQNQEPEDLSSFKENPAADLTSSDQPSLNSFNSTYSLHEKIGSGGFGSVFRVTHLHSGAELVAKKIKTESDTVPSEITLMAEISHPQIIRLLEFYTTPRHLLIILELLPGCMDMFDYIDIKKRMSEVNTKYILRQLSSALSYLHEEKQIAHLDVKPENILIQPSTGIIRLIDFGAAQRITQDVHSTFSGTKQYASPEILFTGHYNPVAADIWAFGVTFYKMVMGHIPFKRTRDYLNPLTFTYRGVSSLCLETISIILNPNPNLRPLTIRDIRSCHWMRT